MSNSLVPSGNSYTTYLLTTQTNILEYNGFKFGVRRWFREVVTLLDRFAESYRGFSSRRGSTKTCRFSGYAEAGICGGEESSIGEVFEEARCSFGHSKNDEFKLFLQVQGKLPLSTSIDMASRMLDGAVKLPKQLVGESTIVVAAPHEMVQLAKGGRDLLRLFKELKQSVTNDWVGSKPFIVEEDKEFLQNKERMNELEQQLNNASQQCGASLNFVSMM